MINVDTQLYDIMTSLPHYIIKSNNLLNTIGNESDTIINKYLIKIRNTIENDDRILKCMIVHQSMFGMFYECFFQQYTF